MFEKLKMKCTAVALACGAWMTVAASYTPVFAVETTITNKTPEEVSNRVVDVLNSVLMPIGGLIIFVTVVITAVKIISTANKPGDRADALSSLPYIVGGGLLLGGALMASGMIYGLMLKMQGTSTTGLILPFLPF